MNEKLKDFTTKVEKSRQGGYSDTAILDHLGSIDADLSTKIQQSRSLYGTQPDMNNDRDLVNFLSVKYGGKMPTIASVPTEEQKQQQKPLLQKAKEFGTGLLKSGAETVVNTLPTALSNIVPGIAPFTQIAATKGVEKLKQTFPKALEGQTPEEKTGKTTGDIIQMVGPSALALEKAAVKGLPKLLSFTSDVPEEVLKRNLTNPSAMKEALETAKIGQGEQVLSKVQQGVKTLRTTISKEYEEAKQHLLGKYQEKTMSLTPREQTLIQKAEKDFSFERTPVQINQMSTSEALDFYREINELYSKPLIQASAQGSTLRALRNSLQLKLKTELGDDFVNLNKNYSSKKSILDAADNLVRAYKTNNPVAQSTALARLKMIYRENKGAYLQAIQDLERETGTNITDYVAALQQVPILPKAGFSVSPFVKKADLILRSLLFPITSPRSAAAIMRGLGKTEEGLQKAGNTIIPKALPPEKLGEIKSFPRQKGLSYSDSQLQEKAIKKYVLNKEQMVNDYIQNFSEGGKVVNTDNARNLFREDGYAGTQSAAVQEASSAIAKEAWKRILATNKERYANILAGGSGSGKTSTIEEVIPGAFKNTAGVLDGNLSSYNSAKKSIKEAQNAGKTYRLFYVYREPEDAWRGVIERMIGNPKEAGRLVPSSIVSENHTGSLKVIKQLYNEGHNIRFIDNSRGRGNAQEVGIDFINNIRYNENMRARFIKIAKEYYDAGKITKEQYRALIK